MGCWQLPPPPPPSTPRRSLHHPLPPPVGRNARRDSSSTNNALNNNSCSRTVRRRITATTTMAKVVTAVVGVAPPTHLPPRVLGHPTSTPGLALFRCDRVPMGSTCSNPTCVHSLCWLVPFPMVLYHRSGHPSHRHSRLCPIHRSQQHALAPLAPTTWSP
jgi:hypothetical protein